MGPGALRPGPAHLPRLTGSRPRSHLAGAETMTSIALIGDVDPRVTAHQAIPAALARAASDARLPLTWTWVHTTHLGADVAPELEPFSALWCVPGSPYANTKGALAAIRFARETGRPYLGTCAGFQHGSSAVNSMLRGGGSGPSTNPGRWTHRRTCLKAHFRTTGY